MKTVFIGSQYDLINCNRALMVDTEEILDIDKLDLYEISYFKNGRKLLFTRVDGELSALIGSGEYKFNYLVYYNDFGVPIGFTDLQQVIDTKKYGIEKIRLKLDFTIFNQEVKVNTLFDYNDHIEDTLEKVAHLSLFNSNDRSVTKTDINSLKDKPTQFSKNQLDIFHSNNKLYKYSGKFAIGNEFTKVSSIQIPIKSIKLLELIEYNGLIWLISESEDSLIFSSSNNTITLPLKGWKVKYLPSKLNPEFIPLVGSNGVILTNGKSDKFILVKDIIEEVDKETMIETRSNKVEWFYTKNPISKSIMFTCKYRGLTKKIYEDRELYGIRTELNVKDQTADFKILLASEGLIVTEEYSDSKSENESVNYYLYNYITKGYSKLGKSELPNSIASLFIITKDAILFRKEISETFSGDDVNLYLREFQIDDSIESSLGKLGTHRRLYKLMKTQRLDWINLNITNLSLNGNSYIIEDNKLQIL